MARLELSVEPITATIIASAITAVAAGVRGVIWLIDRHQDRKALLRVTETHPERIDDFGRAIERTRKARWQLPGRGQNEPPAIESDGQSP
jgi:hypothetical protein